MHQSQRAQQPSIRRHASAADSSAPSRIEYAIIAVLIAAVAVGTWKTFGEGVPDVAAERSAAP